LIRLSERRVVRERLPTLLDWHTTHEVSAYERHRNAGIFTAQGNRNPLIDHPDWADRIDFTVGVEG
jgi:endonuclease I